MAEKIFYIVVVVLHVLGAPADKTCIWLQGGTSQ